MTSNIDTTPKTEIMNNHDNQHKKLFKELTRISLRKIREKNKIIERLRKYSDESNLSECPFYKYNNTKKWTIADLFIRQYLNNGMDGFGLKNVCRMYKFLCIHRETLIRNKMVSENGWNNFGFPLWKNFEYNGMCNY